MIKIGFKHMLKIEWSAEQLIKLSIWIVFIALALCAIFDFNEWVDRLKWMVRSILTAIILHVAVGWIYKQRDTG